MATQNICLGVEISQDGLKIALVEPERRNVIKIDSVPTSGNSINDVSIYSSVVGSWMRSSSQSSKISSVAVAFPSFNGIMRLITIPKGTENASDYVNWEFDSATDSKATDYNLDTAFYPNEKKPERAIVTAMRKSVVDSFRSAKLGETGFRPSSMVSDICALLNLLENSEGLNRHPKCVLKADEKFVTAFWGNETGPLAIRLLPKNCISPVAIAGILDSGFSEFPKAKRKVKFCGELSENTNFANELTGEAYNLDLPIEIKTWDSLSKFSFDKKGGNFSKLSQCMGAIGATLSCI
ncbi:MAG: hypothetical protein LBQ87_06325 [Candidatus Fibromonas sp.]|jgi:hypothetical protein|nr:hypothetical protein [Candidatus Fibromonas sp.]